MVNVPVVRMSRLCGGRTGGRWRSPGTCPRRRGPDAGRCPRIGCDGGWTRPDPV